MSAPFPRRLTAKLGKPLGKVVRPVSARGSDEEILERIERSLEERRGRRIHLRLRTVRGDVGE
jgi:hypothetical protein